MPGLTIYSNIDIKEPILTKFSKFKSTLLIDEQIKVRNTAYSDYPIQTLFTENYQFIIEGFIYGEKQLKKQLIDIADGYFLRKNTEILIRFIENTDGEYIILCKKKNSSDFFIFNDYLGRLPFYYYKTNKGFILSREISTISSSSILSLDKISATEFLLLGYPLGNKTLYQQTKRLEPASVISYEHKTEHFKVEQLISFDFSSTNRDIKDPKEAARHLKELFLDAVKLRAKPNKRHVLSLSGGLDSRAILAAFRILDIPHKQVTYNLGGSTNADLNSVRKLVDITNPQFKLIQLEPENKYSEKLFQMKEGLNYLGMSFLIEFLEIIQEKHDYYWTGDGGDKLLPDTSPLRNLFSLKDLTNYTLQTQQILNPNEIGEILPVNSKGIAQHISQHFESYPEKGYSDKFRRFLYLERAYKWLFEGEDRNRYFLTSVSPFYAIPFFKFAMSIPTETKSDFKVFREFLNLLDPKIASIENANWGVSINQKKEINRIYNKQKIKSYLSIFLDLEKNNIQEKKYHIDTLQKVMRKLSYE